MTHEKRLSQPSPAAGYAIGSGSIEAENQRYSQARDSTSGVVPDHMKKPTSVMASTESAHSLEKTWAKKKATLDDKVGAHRPKPSHSNSIMSKSNERNGKQPVKTAESARTGSDIVVQELKQGRKPRRDSASPDYQDLSKQPQMREREVTVSDEESSQSHQ